MQDNLANSSSSQIPPTQNPQAIGSQNLGAPKSDLQTTLNQPTNNIDARITSVGDSQFTPIDATSSTVVTKPSPVVTTTSKSSIGIVLLLAAVVVTVCMVTVFVMYKQSKQKLIK
jgi:hypothetical protein